MTKLFDHEQLSVYQKALAFVGFSEKLLVEWESSYAVSDQLLRASESVVRNISEGCSLRSKRSRVLVLDYALGSTLECAACLDVALAKSLVEEHTATEGKLGLVEIARMLVGLRKAWRSAVRDGGSTYTAGSSGKQQKPLFSHESLEVYHVALAFVTWVHRLCSEEATDTRISRQIDATATSIALNIAEGNGRFSELDHRRFLTAARTSAVKAAASLDIAVARGNYPDERTASGKDLLRRIVAMLVPLSEYWKRGAERRVLEDGSVRQSVR